MYVFLKRYVLRFDLKEVTVFSHLRCSGKQFQAASQNAWSPYDFKPEDGTVRRHLVEERSDLTGSYGLSRQTRKPGARILRILKVRRRRWKMIRCWTGSQCNSRVKICLQNKDNLHKTCGKVMKHWFFFIFCVFGTEKTYWSL